MSRTNYDNLHNMSKEELSKFFANNINYDDTPWERWFSEKYCEKCEPIEKELPPDYYHWSSHIETYSYCEIHRKCRFFEDMDEIPDIEQTLLMWLEEDADG